MPIVIKRRENESNERLIRRFSRRIQTSGVLLRAKKRQHHDPGKNRNQRRKDALRRLTIRTKNEFLRRVGLLDDELTRDNRGRR